MDQASTRGRSVGDFPDVQAFWEATRSAQLTPYHFVLLVGLKTFDPIRIAAMVSEGLPYRALERFQKNTRFSTSDIGDLVAIAPRTMHRRKDQGRLAPDESDRLLRVTRIFAKTLQLFEGDARAARAWFQTPVKALGGESPFHLARTDVGAREVESLIDRLEHGVLA